MNHRSSAVCLHATSQKVDDREQHDLEYQTDNEQLLIRARFKSEEADMQIQLTDVVEYPTCCEIPDVHDRVDDRERHRPMSCGGVASRSRQQHRRPECFANGQWEHPADEC